MPSNERSRQFIWFEGLLLERTVRQITRRPDGQLVGVIKHDSSEWPVVFAQDGAIEPARGHWNAVTNDLTNHMTSPKVAG